MSWQTSLLKKLKHLKSSEVMSDVILIVGKKPHQKTFQSHRFLLSVFSEVFEAMFYSHFAESKEVEFPEDDSDAFETIIHYIYTGDEKTENVQKTIEVCRLADKYLIIDLKLKCVKYLLQRISSKSVVKIYEMATELMEHKLRVECWKHILVNTKEVLEADSFINSRISTVKNIISKDSLNISTEIIVYNAVLCWGKEQCRRKEKGATVSNIRQIIEPLLHKVRFLAMAPEEFVIGPGKDEILTVIEKIAIMKNIIVPNSVEVPKICNTKRQKRIYNIIKISPITSRKISPTPLSHFPTIKQRSKPFTCDTYISGVIFYLSEYSLNFKAPDSFECTLSVCNVTKGTEINNVFNHFQLWEQNCRVNLQEPFFVAENEECEICLKGEYFKNQALFYCHGDCQIENFSPCGIYHFHSVIVVEI